MIEASLLFGSQAVVDELDIARSAIKIAHTNEINVRAECDAIEKKFAKEIQPGIFMHFSGILEDSDYRAWRKRWLAAQRQESMQNDRLIKILEKLGIGDFRSVGQVWNF